MTPIPKLDDQESRKLQIVLLALLTSFASLYTLYFAAPILIPVTLGILISLILQPVVKLLVNYHLPAPFSAGLVVMSIIILLVVCVYTLSGPASKWIDEAPSFINDIEVKIQPLRGSIEQIQNAQKRIEKLNDLEDPADNATVQQAEPKSISLSDTLLASSSFLVSALFVLVLVYLLLASDGNYLRKLVTTIPRFKDKRRAVETTNAIQNCISRYLLTITLINIGLGLLTTCLMWYLGMPNPVLWGLMVTVLNYIPYLGPAIAWMVLLIVGFITFEDTTTSFLPAIAFSLLTIIEGYIVTPMLAGRKLELSNVAIFVFLAFMGWIWGVVGLIIAIPLLASIRTVCAEIVPLKPIAIMLGRE